MSKPSAPSPLKFAGWIMALALIAVAVIALTSAASRQHKSAAPESAASAAPSLNAEQRAKIGARFDALPVAFEANAGQTDPQVKYMARGNGYTLFLTGNEAVFAVRSSASDSVQSQPANLPGKLGLKTRWVNLQSSEKTAAIRMQPVGGNARAEISAGSEMPGTINYYLGSDPSKWVQGAKQYSAVTYHDVYPGVNLAFHGEQRQLEFDYIVAPGANPATIELGFKGADKIATDSAGNLVLSSTAGDVLLHRPVAYQEKDSQRQLVDVSFKTSGTQEVAFAIGAYDHSRELVIDPSLSYASYLGGASEDEVFGIAVDSSNNVYVTGESESTSGFPGGNAPTSYGFYVFVTKLTSQGALVYTTFVGGTKTSSSTNNDSGLAIAADSSGSAYVTGITESADFPIVGTNPPQPTAVGLGTSCTNNKNVTGGSCSDAFALKLSSGGSTVWSTFIGGQNDDHGYGIALDSMGNVWVAGDTFSSSFYPNTHATTALYSDFNQGVATNPPADDGFVVEISAAGTAPFLFSTYLGGSFSDQINGIGIDSTDNVYVAGQTASTDFPTQNPYQSGCGSDGKCNANAGSVYYDGFVTKIAAGGGSLTYSTYIGGSSDDYAFAIAVDSSGDAYITGETTKDDTTTSPAVPYPTTSGAFSTSYNASATANAFVTELNPTGSALVFSTFLGGSVQDYGGGIAVDHFSDAYVTGVTGSANFPITSNATQAQLNGTGTTGNTDAFVTQVLAGGASLGFSTYLGGSGNENANASGAVGTIALDSSNNMWVGGSTNSTNFPVTTSTAAEATYGGNPYDGFIAEISNATTADFNISATPPSSVSPGSSATSTVTLTSLFGYGKSVNLSCSVTGSGSPLPSCSVTGTNPVTPTVSGATSTVTITTTGSSAALYPHSNFFYALWLPVLGFAAIGIRFSTADSRKKKLLGFLLVGIVMAMLFMLPACSSGSSSGGGGGGGCSGCTPAGNYTVTITGTDSNNLSHSTAVTLTVN